MKDENKQELIKQLTSLNDGSFYFTATEACKILKVSRTKLWRLQACSKIGFRKDGVSKNSAIHFTVNHLAEYILANQVLAYTAEG